MLIFRRIEAKIRTLADMAFQDLAAALEPKLQACLRPARKLQAKVFQIPLEDSINYSLTRASFTEMHYGDKFLDAEVFSDGNKIFILFAEPPDEDSRSRRFRHLLPERSREASDGIALSLIYFGAEVGGSDVEEVIDQIHRIFGVRLESSPYLSSRFKELKEEGRTSPTQPERREIEASKALRAKAVRALAIAVKASGGLLTRDLAKQLPSEVREQVELIQKTLQDHGVVETDIVVVCSKNQSQIARVPTRSALQEMSKIGVRCACGRPIGDEKIEEAVSITEFGRNLLDGSRWQTLLLLEELIRVGVSIDSTLIEQQVGGDEVDCLANISGELVFFEFKDKDFNLGNVYSFGAKIGILRPDHSVIFCTGKVGGDALEHFKRAKMAKKSEDT